MPTSLAAPRRLTITLAPYTGSWTAAEAGHLLRRATYAPLATEIDEAVGLGLTATLNRLLTQQPAAPPPIYYDYDSHPEAGLGDTWEGLYTNPDDRTQDNNARNRSTYAWLMLNQANGGMNLREKMVFFWQNHFGMSSPGDARTNLRFLRLFQAAAYGDFRQLLKDITIDVGMLRFLNGNVSTAASPNENFAREVMELFTLGKGPLAGAGDYTTYTEQDVTELAKAFTGWRTRNVNSSEPGVESESYYQANRHDTTTKQLSARFNNVTIPNTEENEYANVVDVILAREEVSRFLCRKLYRFFVYYEIDAAVENNVIEPLAAIMRANDYQMAPVLRALLGSQHFYESQFVGALVRSPLEVVHGVFRPLGYYFNQGSEVENYKAALRAYTQARDMGLEMLRPPSVSGWTAYYNAPAYYRLWLNTATLQHRNQFYGIALRNNGFFWDGNAHPFDLIAYVDTFPDAYDPFVMIERMAKDFLPRPLAAAQLQALRDLLLPDIDDFVWGNEYGNLQANPNDEALRVSVTRRLQAMLRGMYQLAEFQVF